MNESPVQITVTATLTATAPDVGEPRRTLTYSGPGNRLRGARLRTSADSLWGASKSMGGASGVPGGIVPLASRQFKLASFGAPSAVIACSWKPV